MAQVITCVLQNEQGELIENPNLNFAPINSKLWEIDPDKKKYPWLHTIDEYGNTTFNFLQTPYVLKELEILKNEVSELEQLILNFTSFIQKANNSLYIKFIGD